MNIAIIGVGGVGGYFGGKLTQGLRKNPSTHIYFIARNQHLAAIQENGLILDTDEGIFNCRPNYAFEDISQLPALDFCIICVKAYDLQKVLISLKDKITDSTVILPLLNGIEISQMVRSTLKNGYLHPACVYVGTHIEKPGTVRQRGGSCTIFLGKDQESDTVNKDILSLFDASGIKYVWQENPLVEIWTKFIFIASFGLVTANFNKTIGEVLQTKQYSDHVKGIIHEIISLADKLNVGLPETIFDDTMEKAGRFPFETKTSFQRDFEKISGSDERDLFGGSILRIGRQLGVRTAFTEMIYNSLMKQKPESIPS